MLTKPPFFSLRGLKRPLKAAIQRFNDLWDSTGFSQMGRAGVHRPINPIGSALVGWLVFGRCPVWFMVRRWLGWLVGVVGWLAVGWSFPEWAAVFVGCIFQRTCMESQSFGDLASRRRKKWQPSRRPFPESTASHRLGCSSSRRRSPTYRTSQPRI